MCGIAGFFGEFPEALLSAMSERIAHRGPDDHGTWDDAANGVGLAHRRLSIIDLSPTGHQPMADPANQAVITYNGELYNFRELKIELEAEGVAFRGTSDTEVLLQLYLRYGTDALTRLNGIYAFAIWDQRDSSLIIARDALGVKPLYYAELPQGVLFASELKALLACPDVSRAPDLYALQDYLTYLWCPAPRTPIQGVRKLPPGTAMCIRDHRVSKTWTHYRMPYDQDLQSAAEESQAQGVRSALGEAVQRQLVADVPVGAFLSGGLDSSAVVAMAKQALDGERMPCFTIDPSSGKEGWDGFTEDLPYARAVAKHLDVDLHVIRIGPEIIDRLETMIYHLDEPQGDPACLNVLAISELARQHDIKVLLSGAGGDDLFTGYRRHRVLRWEKYWAWLPQGARRAGARVLAGLPQSRAFCRRVAKAFRFAGHESTERLAGYFHWLSPDVVVEMFTQADRDDIAARPFSQPLMDSLAALPAGTPPLNQMLYLEARHFLADHNLNYTDKMSMAVGVEVRVPFLDLDLVRLACSLPIGIKQHGAVGKHILKRAVRGVLPQNVIHRPKTGFGAPLRYWLRNQLQPLVDDVLSERSLRARGLFAPEAVHTLIQADREGRTDAAYPIFTLLCVELWFRLFVDGARLNKAAHGMSFTPSSAQEERQSWR